MQVTSARGHMLYFLGRKMGYYEERRKLAEQDGDKQRPCIGRLHPVSLHWDTQKAYVNLHLPWDVLAKTSLITNVL